jgi:NhaP-type Na+/H+ or K+/H+ antiporter
MIIMEEPLRLLSPDAGLMLWQIFVAFLLFTGLAIDIAFHKFEKNQKAIWLLICVFVPFGGVVYFALGRKQRILN